MFFFFNGRHQVREFVGPMTFLAMTIELKRLVIEIPDHRMSLAFKPFLKDFNAAIRWPGPLVRPPATELLFKNSVAVLFQPLYEILVRVKYGHQVNTRLVIDLR